MNTGVVSRRFAKALLAYAKGEGLEDKVCKEVKTLAAHFAEVPALRRAVENPVLERSKKLELLCEASGGKDVSQVMTRFLSLVLEDRREKFLQFMMWSYIDLYQEDKHILFGKLTTAVHSPRLVEHLQRLAGKVTNGEVILEEKVDKNLIGGYIIELDGFRLDSSVANQLKRVKQQFIAKNRRIV